MFKLEANPRAMARLALGTSITVATLLCIPDAFALTAITSDFVVWLTRLVGLWLTAAILWFCGFLGILHLARIFGGPIVFSPDGIRLWRLGKVISWFSIKALSVERQDIFAYAFFLPLPVYRLTFYVRKKEGGNLAQVHLPSFTFSCSEFDALVRHVLQHTSKLQPNSIELANFELEDQEHLSNMSRRGVKFRIGLSIFIMFGLVMFLGRKSVVTYEFNLGNKAFRAGDYASAQRHFEVATKTDPAYAIGWDRLARSEFRQGNAAAAEEHWHKALVYKPDLVEAKLGVSKILMQKREYSKAMQLLEQCRRLSPYYTPVYLNLAQLHWLTGQRDKALTFLDLALKQGNVDADSYAACARVALEFELRDRSMSLAKQALSVDPTNREAQSLMTILMGRQP